MALLGISKCGMSHVVGPQSHILGKANDRLFNNHLIMICVSIQNFNDSIGIEVRFKYFESRDFHIHFEKLEDQIEML